MSWLKIALRHHRAGRFYTVLNLSGLAVGIVATLLISLWVHDEWAFDTFHKNHDRIARVMVNQPVDGGITTSDKLPVPLAAELRSHFGENFTHLALYYPNFRHILTVDKEHSVAQIGSWVQPEVPVMLTLPMVAGHIDALKDRASTLISLSLARALFGNTDPLGRTIRVDNNVDVRVGGVFADLPTGSTFHDVSIFLAWDKAVDEMPWMKDYTTDWGAAGFNIYVQLSEHADLNKINRNIRNVLAQYPATKGQTLFLQPMSQWHLFEEFSNGAISGGRIRIVRLFTVVGIFILLLACINFMNLATARSEKRAKEVGIRKTIGSLKGQLIAQFLGEAAMMTFAATVLALGLAQLALPFFNQLTSKTLHIPWTSPIFALAIILFIIVTSLLAGSYPAFFLSRFKPVKVLKGDLRSGPSASIPRKILVVLQFTISISLIIGTTLVGRQIAFAKDRPIGYTRAGLLNVGKNTKDLYDANYQALRSDLLKTGMVANMAEAATSLTEDPGAGAGYLTWEGADPNAKPAFANLGVTADYGPTVGW
jgi:hypothetical protein